MGLSCAFIPQSRSNYWPYPDGIEGHFQKIGSGAEDCASAPSHTTGRAVFRIRRLNAAA